tara:strand:- start:61 stop:576 length:516 start_codon:yes stop_codon:yes gene_type:complete
MRFFKYFFILAISVSLISCTKDDDTPAYELNTENLSAGTYEVEYLVTSATGSVIIEGIQVEVSEENTIGEFFNLTYNFSENGMYQYDGEYLNNTTRILADGTVLEDSSIIIVIDNETGTYTVNNSNMQLLLGETLYDVTRFNANELRLSYTTAYTEDGVDYVEVSEIRMVR